jgi:hypothetical protein
MHLDTNAAGTDRGALPRLRGRPVGTGIKHPFIDYDDENENKSDCSAPLLPTAAGLASEAALHEAICIKTTTS